MSVLQKRLRTKPAAAAALGAAIAVGAVVVRRRRNGDVKHTATVVLPPDEVRRRWHEATRATDVLGDVSVGNGHTQQLGARGLEVAVALDPAPGGRGTEIRVAARGRAAQQASDDLRGDLRRIKSVLEAGEALTVEDQPSGRGRLARRVTNRMSKALRRKGRG